MRLPALLALFATACAAPPHPASPSPSKNTDTSTEGAFAAMPAGYSEQLFAIPNDLHRAASPATAAPPFRLTGAGNTPALCKAYVTPQTKPSPRCDDRSSALDALGAALQEGNDGALASLEGCAALPAMLVRAIRIERAPAECGEAMASAMLSDEARQRAVFEAAIQRLHPSGAPVEEQVGSLLGVLRGQTVRARVKQAIPQEPVPSLKGKAPLKFDIRWINTELGPWVKARSQALHDVQELVGQLPDGSYGRALATSELGLVYTDFARAFRAAPIPPEFKTDDRARSNYFAALDAISDPFKEKGLQYLADAGAQWASQGVLYSALATTVHTRFTKLVPAFKSMIFTPGMAAPSETDRLAADQNLSALPAEQRLLAQLPMFAIDTLFSPEQLRAPERLQAALKTGLPRSLWGHFEAKDTPPELRHLLARGHGELGLRWRTQGHWDELLRAEKEVSKRTHEDMFWIALALAHRQMHWSLPQLLSSTTPPEATTEALEALALAQPPGPFAAQAIIMLVATQDMYPPPGGGTSPSFQKTQQVRLQTALPLLPVGAARSAVDEAISDRELRVKFLEAGP